MTSENSNTEIKEVGFGLDWNKVNTWDWADVVEPLSINISKNKKSPEPQKVLGLYPKVVKLYALFKEKANVSSFDSDSYSLPIAESDLSNVVFLREYGKVELDGKELWHSGIDLASVDKLDGIPIRAVAAGTIFSSNFSPSYGNNIIVKHDIDSNYSIYCHLKERIKKDGELVKKGEIIGYMGSTGSAERSELHLQINSFIDGDYKNGAENPLKYFPKLADKLGRSSLA